MESTSNEINLLESTTFTRTIECQLPGQGVDTMRDFKFTAKFEVKPQDEWEDICATSTKSEALRMVLVGAEGCPGATLPDGTKLTPVDVAIRNPFTCDAAFAEYSLFTSRNGRNAAKNAAEAKNSKRSRVR